MKKWLHCQKFNFCRVFGVGIRSLSLKQVVAGSIPAPAAMLKVLPNKPTWQGFVDRLVGWGLDRQQVVAGSMPEATLGRLGSLLSGNGLQIGGFVGVSHCCLAVALKGKGTICTIDPNIPHRNISGPFLYAQRLVAEYRLKNSMLVVGYAKDQMDVLYSQGARFDFVLLDGQHDRETVLGEVVQADRLLKPGGYLVLDDIDFWDGPKSVYNDFPLGYNRVVVDERVGVLVK